MNRLIPSSYLEVLNNRDFFLLSLVILIGQVASACLLLSLIVSVFSKTGSNFGVSGVILSFTVPSLLLMVFAGIAADVFNRKKIILYANIFISLVVIAVIATEKLTFTLIPLSFLYFAGNSFFIPASSAATAQVVKKSQLLVANSVFITILAGGIVSGFIVGSVINFFFGNRTLLMVCESLLILAVIISLFLPDLYPVSKKVRSVKNSISSISMGFSYIFSRKLVWLYFVTFAGLQGVILFGVTIAPGFYDEIIGISIERSPIFIFPFMGLGLVLGFYIVNYLRFSEASLIKIGALAMGLSLFLMGIAMKISFLPSFTRLLMNIPFLTFLGFGAIMILIGSRTGLQKMVPHSNQGTVFGANILLSSLLSTFMSPMGAVFEVLFGYLGILVLGGMAFIALFGILWALRSRWK